MPTFEECVQHITSIGWQYEVEVNYRDDSTLKLFDSITPDITPEEWMQLCCRGGRWYLGGCCANMSEFQDIVNNMFRMEVPHLKVETLSNIAHTSIAHGDDWFERSIEVLLAKPDRDVMDKLCLAWALVREHYRARELTPYPHRTEWRAVDNAIADIDHLARRVSWHSMFMGEVVSSQDKSARAVAVAKLIPPLQTLTQNIRELSLGDFEGWAITGSSGEEVMHNRLGLCMYATVEELQRTLRYLVRAEQAPISPEGALEDRFKIRRVFVSWEVVGGYRFTSAPESITQYIPDDTNAEA